MKRIIRLLIIIATLCSHTSVIAGVASHAPIDVMGDHSHNKGEWMTSYRYMHMDMPQSYTGAKQLSVEQVHDDFMVAPVDMTMEMHMLELMYGVTDQFTAMIMLPYHIKDMEHRRRNNSRQFSTHAQGIGDIQIGAMYSLHQALHIPMHLNMSLSLPIGSIDRIDTTLLGDDQPLPYPMQLGSGTVDLHPGLTYTTHHKQWSWGAQALSTIRLGKNEHKYKLGNRYEVNYWLAYTWKKWISTSLRVKGHLWGNINGLDARLNPMMVPTADPDNQAGERVDFFFGINLLGQKGVRKGHRLGLEIGYPVYQRLEGPQLGVGLQGTIGWQKAW